MDINDLNCGRAIWLICRWQVLKIFFHFYLRVQDTGVFVYSTIMEARYLIVSSFIITFQFKGNELN